MLKKYFKVLNVLRRSDPEVRRRSDPEVRRRSDPEVRKGHIEPVKAH